MMMITNDNIVTGTITINGVFILIDNTFIRI